MFHSGNLPWDNCSGLQIVVGYFFLLLKSYTHWSKNCDNNSSYNKKTTLQHNATLPSTVQVFAGCVHCALRKTHWELSFRVVCIIGIVTIFASLQLPHLPFFNLITTIQIFFCEWQMERVCIHLYLSLSSKSLWRSCNRTAPFSI